MNLDKLDVRTLKILYTLLRERNTVRSAEFLGIGQPNVSRTLAQLRTLFSDPLLVRQSRGMQLTPKGERLLEKLPAILSAYNDLLENTDFSPMQIKRKLRFALNTYLMESHGFAIYQAVKAAAPEASVELLNYHSMTINEILSGRVDVALNYGPTQAPKELCQVQVGIEHFVGICRASHPLAGCEANVLEMTETYPMCGLIAPQFNQHGMMLEKDFDFFSAPVMRSEQLSPLLKLVESTDTILVATQALYSQLNTTRFSCILPTASEHISPSVILLMFNNRYYTSQESAWLTSLVKSVISKGF